MRIVVLALLVAGCISKPARDPDRGAAGDRTWRQITGPGAELPGPLLSPRLAYDRVSEHVYLFGGAAGEAVSNIMWRLDGDEWVTVCEDCLGLYEKRYRSGFAADGEFFVFGGVSDAAGGDQHAEVYTSPTGAKWDFFPTSPMPSPRDQASLVPFHGKIYQVGGYGAGKAKDDADSLETNRWTPETDNAVNMGGAGQSVTVDSDHDRILALQDNSGNGAADGLYAYDGSVWDAVCSACTGVKRSDASLLHIPGADVTLIIGGNVQGSPTNETWSAQGGGAFATLDEPGTLPSRASTGVAFDPIRDRVILYGGVGPDCENGCSGTYELVLK